MTSFYPLRFEPVYRHYLWGGRRMESLLGRDLAPGMPYAESWEIVDHGDDQSVVRFGPLAGHTLHELVAADRDALLGSHARRPAAGPLRDRFPLLLKFLDAAENLSLQVHPDDAMAARLDPPELGKTEAWFVLAAEPGSRIHAGLKPGVDRNALARAIDEGACAECVHSFEARPGDALLIPAGTVHALGAGLLVAEIQQAADTTFRLFDWNRVAPDGKPRPLHVEQALEAIDFAARPPAAVHTAAAATGTTQQILDCPYFTLIRWDLSRPALLGGDGHCHLLRGLDGAVQIAGATANEPLGLGQTILLPAALPPVGAEPRPKAILLDVTVL